MIKLALVGLGPHSKRIYYPFIEKYSSVFDIRLEVLVELESQKESVDQYLATKPVRPEQTLFIPESERMGDRLTSSVKNTLDYIHANKKIDGLIIATEPKSHKKYLQWAISNNIDVLTDKPITSPVNLVSDIKAAQQIYSDYKEIRSMLSHSKSNIIVQCQRRYHQGYKLIHELASEVVETFEVPITYMDIYHADGMWNMPHEFFLRENHPYKYGYGKLMHSGYHFIDLYSWFSQINSTITNKSPNKLEIFAKSYRPKDFFYALDEKFYAKFLPSNSITSFFNTDNPIEGLGELDVYLKIQSLKDDRVINTTSLDLQQNSFSRRAWPELPPDTYKGNGRVRHERFNLQISNLLNIQAHSYQAYEVKKVDQQIYGAGNENHFDIYVFRNAELIGGQPFTKFSLGESMKDGNRNDVAYIGHNEKAREDCFLDFIRKRTSNSNFLNHDFTNRVLSEVYHCLALESMHQSPMVQMNI